MQDRIACDVARVRSARARTAELDEPRQGDGCHVAVRLDDVHDRVQAAQYVRRQRLRTSADVLATLALQRGREKPGEVPYPEGGPAHRPLETIEPDARPVAEGLVGAGAEAGSELRPASARHVGDHSAPGVLSHHRRHARGDRRLGERLRADGDALSAERLEAGRRAIDVNRRLTQGAPAQRQIAGGGSSDVASAQHDARAQDEGLAGVIHRQISQQVSGNDKA